MEFVTLNNGVDLPALGFGVFQTPPEETRVAVETALADGYRHVDTAAVLTRRAALGASSPWRQLC
jgi:2,5-diketo-D-gluconate reductase A